MQELTIRPLYKGIEVVEVPDVQELLVISPCIGLDFFFTCICKWVLIIVLSNKIEKQVVMSYGS